MQMLWFWNQLSCLLSAGLSFARCIILRLAVTAALIKHSAFIRRHVGAHNTQHSNITQDCPLGATKRYPQPKGTEIEPSNVALPGQMGLDL
ncbi:MAG: hypothetical protein KGL01_00495 [Betaproteobacteria bacterium]|nr:hypothetical protein [Betaproteobacteria bacterium]